MLIRNPVSAHGNDLYETPEVARFALLRAEPLPRTIWEPACGPGAIVRVLRDAGHQAIATDLIDYRSPDQDHVGRDFLLERKTPNSVEMIVTNPPGKLAAQFAAHALSLSPRVAMLLRLSFFESGNEKTKAGRTLTSTVGEAGKWRIEESDIVSPLFGGGRAAMAILQSKLHPDDRNGGDVDDAKRNGGRFVDKKIAALQRTLHLNAVFISSRAAR